MKFAWSTILAEASRHPTPASRAYDNACHRREVLAQYLSRHGDGSAKYSQREQELDDAITSAAEELQREYETTHD